ncbi:hypothetical protein R1flu_018505 [Riccia fluitans]|uniref:Endonuclease/exonuclease/phosphatase domain-containing protein n=1 Tax=Riccia fluitans TaxID=41844 RepID=A0ABD1ZH17_9MARC
MVGGSQQHVGGVNWVRQEDCGTVLEDARRIQTATEGEFLSEEVNSVDDEKAESSLVKSSNKGGLVRNLKAKQSIVFKSAGGKSALVSLESACSRDPDSRRLSGIKALVRKGQAPTKKVLPGHWFSGRSLDWLDAPFEGKIEENMRGDGGDSLKDCWQILGELDSNGREAERSGSERDVNSEEKIGRRTSKAAEVKKWIRFNKGGAKAIGLQEIKWNGWGMQRWLKSIFKDGTVIFDQLSGSKGGMALILHGSLCILETGTGGDVCIAWAKVQNGDSWFGILSVYVPNKSRVRIELWEKIKRITRDREWVILGDFNQVNLPEVAVGRSNLVRGREERWWHQFLVEKGLVDGSIYEANRMGGQFTRVARKARRLEASRLDRFYFT